MIEKNEDSFKNMNKHDHQNEKFLIFKINIYKELIIIYFEIMRDCYIFLVITTYSNTVIIYK